MDGTTEVVTRGRAAVGGVAVVLGASAAAWALAYPQAAPAATVARALADCGAAATLGLTVVPMLDAARHRAELTRRAGGPLAWASGFWLCAELSRLVVGAAAAAGVPVTRVGVTTTTDFAFVTSAGRSGLFSVLAAGLVMAAPAWTKAASFGPLTHSEIRATPELQAASETS